MRIVLLFSLMLAACSEQSFTTGLNFGSDGVSVSNSVSGNIGGASVTVSN